MRSIVSDSVKDIISTVASYPLPDEAPTEEPIVHEEKIGEEENVPQDE